VARGLEGIVRSSSINAAAVVIADRPLAEIVPLQLVDSNKTDEHGERMYRTVTQFSMKPVEQIGLLKMDFLGLRNLDVIEDALDMVERSTGERPDMSALPLDDVKTYEMLARGGRSGCSGSTHMGCGMRSRRSSRRSSTISWRWWRCTGRAR
jgi:DNA polymerase-3 subunit alpha